MSDIMRKYPERVRDEVREFVQEAVDANDPGDSESSRLNGIKKASEEGAEVLVAMGKVMEFMHERHCSSTGKIPDWPSHI